MSALTFWTWAAIAVLVVGSTAVFAWFLADAVRRRARTVRNDDPDAPD